MTKFQEKDLPNPVECDTIVTKEYRMVRESNV